jgi:capsular exopolysaccharide synthesis family protein
VEQREPQHIEEQEISIKQLLQKAWFYKYWFVASLVICISAAFLYLRYTKPTYEAKAKIIIRANEKTGLLSGEQLFQDLGMFSGDKNVLNEIEIINSHTLMEEVVQELGLNYEIIAQGNVKNTEIYEDPPIVVDSFTISGTYEIELVDADHFRIREEDDDNGEIDTTLSFNDLHHLGDDKLLSISIGDPERFTIGENLLLKLSTVFEKAKTSLKDLQVNRQDDWSTVVNIRMPAENPEKAADIINTLLDIYIDHSIEEKNQTYEQTLDFIRERIANLTDELGSVERSLEVYKREHDIAGQAVEAVEKMGEELMGLERQLSQLEVQLEVLKSLEEILEDPEKPFQLLPASLSTNNKEVNASIERYNEMVLQRRRLLISAGRDNPLVESIEEQLYNVKEATLESIDVAQQETQIAMNKSERQISSLESEFRSIPRKERELLEIVRQQRVKESLYLYLLEKKEEIALTMQMAESNVRIIDRARTTKEPVSPKSTLIYALGALLGLALPVPVLYIREVMDNKVQSREDITKRTEIPLIGEIMEDPKAKDQLVVTEGGATAEMFRLLRTNVNFLISGQTPANILITSYESGEGKTFIATNLALTYALAGKKVALLGLDLRKPKLHSYFDYPATQEGLTNYILGEVQLEDILLQSGEHQNLDVVFSGPVPPNPAELVLNERFNEFIQGVSEIYDIIIWDTAPIGLVSDTLNIKDKADASLFVMRQGMTEKKVFEVIDERQVERKLPNLSIVLNGIQSGSFYGYGKYRYGYGRNKGYYTK